MVMTPGGKSCWLLARGGWALSVVAALCIVGSGRQVARAQQPALELAVGTGEIRLDGEVRAVNVTQRNLVIEATAFVVAGGRSGQIKPPKTKTVVVQKARCSMCAVTWRAS